MEKLTPKYNVINIITNNSNGGRKYKVLEEAVTRVYNIEKK